MSAEHNTPLWNKLEYFHGAFVHSAMGMALVSHEGKFLDVNPALCGFLGCSRDQLLQTDFQAITHPEDLAQDLAFAQQLWEGERDWYSMEKRYISFQGQILWARLTVSLAHEEQERPAFFISQVQDIARERLAAEEILSSRERLRQTALAGNVGTWEYNFTTQQVDWNEVTFAIHAMTPQDYMPHPDNTREFLHPDDAERVLGGIRDFIASGQETFQTEYRIRRHNGEIRHLRTGAGLLRDESGHPLRLYGTLIDLTDEKLAIESAQAVSRAKGEFLTMTSHEIRTPMNGILGFIELLQATPLNEIQRDYVETIAASGRRLLEVVNDLLDLAHIETGSLPVRPAPFSLRPCVQDVLETLRPIAQEKHLDLSLDFPEGLPAAIVSDRGRLSQILTNLLGNAIKFTEHGGVSLAVSGEPPASEHTDGCGDGSGDGDEWTWKFTVADTGPGIPPEDLPRIFEAFYRGSAAKTSGSGLGLMISQRIVALLGGNISVSNRLPHGAEFCATILAPRAPDKPQ